MEGRANQSDNQDLLGEDKTVVANMTAPNSCLLLPHLVGTHLGVGAVRMYAALSLQGAVVDGSGAAAWSSDERCHPFLGISDGHRRDAAHGLTSSEYGPPQTTYTLLATLLPVVAQHKQQPVNSDDLGAACCSLLWQREAPLVRSGPQDAGALQPAFGDAASTQRRREATRTGSSGLEERVSAQQVG